MDRREKITAVVFLLSFVLGAEVFSGDELENLQEKAKQYAEPTLDPHYSNILPKDYVGAKVCMNCHDSKYDSWGNHAHSQMNRKASAQSVKGDFSGVREKYGPGEILFHTEEGNYYMSFFIQEELVRKLKVTLVVGSRFYQFYIGLQVEGPEDTDHPAFTVPSKLPFGYSYLRQRWLPELYFDSYPPAEHDYDDGRSFGEYIFDDPPEFAWNESCVSCHNTFPYGLRFKGGGWKKGFPEEDIGLNLIDGTFEVLSWRQEDLQINEHDLIQFGISCESCHFGGREHSYNEKKMSFVPTHPSLKIRHEGSSQPVASDPKNPYVVNSICRQCHSAEVGRYANGAARWNSAEALDQDAGACTSQVMCTSCHNPHKSNQLGRGEPDREHHVKACISCHPKFEDSTFASNHSRHSDKVNCLDCHMPKYVQGLETIVRSHTISSPSDLSMLEAGHPNACNLCHLDKPVRWTVEELNKGWGTEIETDLSWIKNYAGSLKRPVGLAWLRSEDPVIRLIANHSYSVSEIENLPLQEMLKELLSDYAVNRLFGLVSVEKVLGRKLTRDEYDLLQTPEHRKVQVTELIKKLCNTSAKKQIMKNRR